MQEIDYSTLPDDFEFNYDENWDLILPENKSENKKNIIIKDVDWKILQNWDSVIAIKDLNTKLKVKRWEKFKNIKLLEDWLIQSWKAILKPEFFKKN